MSGTTATWVGTNGDWSTPSLWSGTIVPSAADDVSIVSAFGTGGTITVSAGETVATDSLTLDGGNLETPGPTLDVVAGGTLNVGGPVVLGGAQIDLGGVLYGTLTASPPPPGWGYSLSNTGTLVTSGGTLIGAIELVPRQDLVVSGTGLNLLSPGGTAAQITIGGALEFDGTQTLNNVTITLGGDLSGGGELDVGQPLAPVISPSLLTLGPNVLVEVSGGLIEGNGTLVNQGVIDVVNPGEVNRYLDSFDAGLINEGTVDAASGTRVNLDGGTAQINAANGLIVAEAGADVTLFGGGGSVVNAGTITLATGAIVTFAGTEDLTAANPFATFGSIDNNGGTIVLGGLFSNAGKVLTLSDLTSLYGPVSLTGTIQGGTVVADENIVPSNDYVLDGVTWDGSIVATGIVSIYNDVTLHGLDGTGQGFINATAPGAGLSLDGSLASALISIGNAATASTVGIYGTFGPDVTLSATSPGAAVILNSPILDIQTPPISMVNQGVIDAAAAGGSFTINGGVENTGTIIAENGDTVTFAQNQTAVGGMFRLATDGTLAFDGSAPSGGTIDFVDASATMLRFSALPGSGQAGFPEAIPTVSGFQAGNQIDLVPWGNTIPLPLGDYAASFVSGSIDVTINGTAYIDIPVVPGENYTGDQFAFQSDGGTGVLLSIACFLPGTLIRTDQGEIAVEKLKTGDTVITLSGQKRRLCWIGQGRALATRGQRGAATPVIVRKGALADNVPYADLRITKGHSLYIDGVLIPVEFLVNHRSILWDDGAREVTVFHLELDAHDVLVANGAAAESYRDDGNRWLFSNANAGWDQPPQPPCAPVLTGGNAVDAIWRRLLDRSGPRVGVPLTDDPDLHLLVDGQRLDATQRAGGAYVFSLSHQPEAVRIVSRAAVPQELGMGRDPRCLGVALGRVVVRQGTRFQATKAADPRLVDGFHGFEADTLCRWTNGDATLPIALLDGWSGPAEIVLMVGGVTHYIDDGVRQLVA
jgi:hypothetical protein